MKTKRKVENEVGSTKELLRLKRKKVNLDQLYLDPDNPRFGSARGISDKRVLEDSVQNNAQKKIETIGIADLLSSILRYGFVSTDPVVVRRLGDGKFVVVEGNRRVATLKKLFNSHKKGEVTLDKDILCSITDLVVLWTAPQ